MKDRCPFLTPCNSVPVPSCPCPLQAISLSALLEDVGKVAAAAVLAVLHGGHEDTGTALLAGALAAKTLDLAIAVDLVVLEHSELGLLALVLDLLRPGM
jgi:hypothetical protein